MKGRESGMPDERMPTLGEQIFASMSLVLLVVTVLLVWRCLSMRLIGRIQEGVLPRWSNAYLCVQLKSDTVRVWTLSSFLHTLVAVRGLIHS